MIALDSSEPAVSEEQSTATKIRCDITDPQQLEKVFRDYEIGCGGSSRGDSADRSSTRPGPCHKSERRWKCKPAGIGPAVRRRSFRLWQFVKYLRNLLSRSCRFRNRSGCTGGRLRRSETLCGATGPGSYRLRAVQFVSLRIGRVVGPGAHSTTSAWRSAIFELLQTRRLPISRFRMSGPREFC